MADNSTNEIRDYSRQESTHQRRGILARLKYLKEQKENTEKQNEIPIIFHATSMDPIHIGRETASKGQGLAIAGQESASIPQNIATILYNRKTENFTFTPLDEEKPIFLNGKELKASALPENDNEDNEPIDDSVNLPRGTSTLQIPLTEGKSMTLQIKAIKQENGEAFVTFQDKSNNPNISINLGRDANIPNHEDD